MIFNLLFNASENTINPWTLMLIGMAMVFAGLLILNIVINLLKFFSKDKHQDNMESKKIDEHNRAILNNVELSDDEILATSIAISIEYDLYYSDEHYVLTIKSKDKEPMWIYSKRR